jgi:hypothetical protein
MVAARSRVGVALAGAVVLSLGSVLGAAAAGTAAATGANTTTGTTWTPTTLQMPGPCPETRATGSIHTGLYGIGWTTVHGDWPQPFRVRVLGTLVDGIGPGRDLIIIRVSDLPGRRVIAKAHGIWAGMSGSPVYIGGKLAGAISYSLADGPSPIGGMTPARLMTPLVTETSARASRSRSASSPGRSVVRLTGSLNRSVAASSGASRYRTTTLQRLAVPVMVSGGASTRHSFLTRELRRRLGSIRVVSTGSGPASSARTPLAAAPRGGSNLAGVIARGDVTIAAVGTVTAVCRGVVIGFGHPFTGEGVVALDAARGSAVAIVGGLEPYKLADIGSTFGVLDRDRIVGIRATAGTRPGALPVIARVHSTDTGRSRTGRTIVADPAWMPSVAADHLLFDVQTVEDRLGGGTALLDWTIKGTRLDTGQTWTLRWNDRVTDGTDVAYAAALRLFDQLETLQENPSAAIRIRSVDVTATVGAGTSAYAIRGVQVSRNGGAFSSAGVLSVMPGDELRIRVRMRHRTGLTTSRTVTVTVPAGAAGLGEVRVIGGADVPTDGCGLDGLSCPTTLATLLDALKAGPRGDDVLVALDLPGSGSAAVHLERTVRMDKVVHGSASSAVDAG